MESIIFNMVFIWALIGIILFFIEFLAPGFVIFFFGLGAITVSLLCYLFPDLTINTQLLVFIITSIAMLLILRGWFKNIFSGIFNQKDVMPKNIDTYIGKTAVVSEEIKPNHPGKIEFHGTEWEANSNVRIKKGESVVIIRQDNITFEVKKI
ncbi:MAG: NfeD family protein [Victivallales bacterium]|nr:NfeD family protein [Victivallales bacterium]